MAFSRLLLFAVLLVVSSATAEAQSRLSGFLANLPAAELVPGADRLGPPEGEPPMSAAFAGDRRLGWVLLNTDWVNATGYSGKPIDVAVGFDDKGTILGAKLLKHSEPIVLIGIPERRIAEFIAGYVGYNVLEMRSDRRPPVDIVAGATVTVVVIGDSITRSVGKALRTRGGGPTTVATARSLDPSQSGTRTWEELLADGSVARLHLTVGQLNEAFARDERAAARPEPGEPGDTFIDLYAAPVSVPVIGRSLLGDEGYRQLTARLAEGQHAILLMSEGAYSFRGSGFVRGGLFDRIELVQGDNAIRFRDRDYERIGDLAAADAPAFPEIGLFVVPAGQSFQPTEPWRLQLLVSRAVGALEKSFLTFALDYRLPGRYLAPPPPAPTEVLGEAHSDVEGEEREAVWQRLWRDKAVAVVVLGVALVALTAAFFFQDWLVQRPRLLKIFRLSFLAFTLVLLGWVWNAQLSVVNVLALVNALITDFRWDYFLMDPLIFILWSATAAALVFWARGAFCGWLCPFGALQEFANLGARRLKVPQLHLPWGLHERLWPIKYVIFLGLFGVSLYSLTFSEQLAEVEPFKTAVILKFVRDWPFVLYAVALVLGSLFVERFFCRYLCPLGAGLAIPARMRTFDWLKRHRECGNPCQRCANECPVGSIHPAGQINPNECIYCMHCQELYWDDQRCPHMIQVRLKRERRESMAAPPPRPPGEP